MLIQGVTHAAIRAQDVAESAEFYRRVLGLTEVGRAGGRLFLSGGRTASYDLALVPGGAGLEHFALAVSSPDDLDEARVRLREAGVEALPVPPEEEFLIADGLRFELPSGHVLEFVVAEDAPYVQPLAMGDEHFFGVGPVPIDHVTLLTPRVRETAEFLTAVLGFRLTESVQPEPGFWLNAFLRCRDQHHDLALFFNGEESGPELNHVAYRVGSFDDIRRACDLVAELGRTVDASPGRHHEGNNLFVYFRDPSGNRIELSTDMAQVSSAAPPRILSESRFDSLREGVAPEVLSGT
jgi:catechol 2,3-dioxygenase